MNSVLVVIDYCIILHPRGPKADITETDHMWLSVQYFSSIPIIIILDHTRLHSPCSSSWTLTCDTCHLVGCLRGRGESIAQKGAETAGIKVRTGRGSGGSTRPGHHTTGRRLVVRYLRSQKVCDTSQSQC